MSQCKLCGYSNIKKIFINTFFSKDIAVYQCYDCGFIFLDQVINEEFLDNFYLNDYRMHGRIVGKVGLVRYILSTATKLIINMALRRRIKVIKKYFSVINKNRISILDVGCTEGDFLKRAKVFGPVYGLEVSDYLTQIAKSKGIEIIGKKTKEINTDKKFDIITCCHVLEHLIDPVQELKNIKKYIQDGGFLICDLPYIPDTKFMDEKDKNIHFNDCHLNHFNLTSIKKFIELAGYEIVELKIVQFYKTLAKCIYSKSNPHYLHPSFFALYKIKVTLSQKIFSTLAALELCIRYFFGFNVFEFIDTADIKKFKPDLTNELFFVLKPKNNF